jgi:hypothetical protein
MPDSTMPILIVVADTALAVPCSALVNHKASNA